VLAALADHLWQSALSFCLLWTGAALSHANAARVRLWMWRIGALKFCVPFALLYALGEWFGFPVKYSDDDPPQVLIEAMQAVLPWSSPAQQHALSAGYAALACLALAPLVALCAWRCRRGLALEGSRARGEDARLEADPDDREPSLGFIKAFLFTAVAIGVLSSPFVGGAVTDRVRRYTLLMQNARSLLNAPIDIAVARPGMGERWRLDVDTSGVTIRNANVQSLVSLAYGVNRLMVISEQMVDKDSHASSWMLEPRYDVRVTGRVFEPAQFDAFALRRPITKLLAERFGYELYLNGRCQPPCGTWRAPLPDEPL
jgi:hypothetical protein